ncbi:MAG: ABC transporter permease subunit [Microlunatus sp.]
MIWSYLLDPANWNVAENGLLLLLGQHLAYTAVAVVVAAVAGILLGILIGHTGHGRFVGTGLHGLARAIPSLGLLVLVVIALSGGIGPITGVLAILALPPILTATAAGVAGADREAVHAARALGMTGNQVVGKVEWPLALPSVISGLRSATRQVVAVATVAGFVSGGGLGQLLVKGRSDGNYAEMFAGAVTIAALAIVLDLLLGLLGWLAARRTNPGGPAAHVALVAGA